MTDSARRVIENVEQKVQFFVAHIAGGDIPVECRKATGDYNLLKNKQKFTSSDGEEFTEEFYKDDPSFAAKLSEYHKAMLESMPDWLKRQCEAFGVDNAGDVVNVSVKTSDVLFDLYRQAKIEPQAPLAKALYQKNLGEIAEKISKDSFSLPDELLEVVQPVLMDEKSWESNTFSATVNVSDENRIPIGLTTKGLQKYTKVMHQVVMAFMPVEENNTHVNEIETK